MNKKKSIFEVELQKTQNAAAATISAASVELQKERKLSLALDSAIFG